MRNTSKFPLYILSLDNLASEKFLAKRKLHHRLKLIYCSLSQRRCWIIACCCYCMNYGYKPSCSLHTFPAEHPPTSLKKKQTIERICFALLWKRRALPSLNLEKRKKKEKLTCWGCTDMQLRFHPKRVPESGVQVAAVEADSTWFLWNHSPIN